MLARKWEDLFSFMRLKHEQSSKQNGTNAEYMYQSILVTCGNMTAFQYNIKW
jgi:hypothetical protein